MYINRYYRSVEIYYEESAHMFMEAGKYPHTPVGDSEKPVVP